MIFSFNFFLFPFPPSWSRVPSAPFRAVCDSSPQGATGTGSSINVMAMSCPCLDDEALAAFISHWASSCVCSHLHSQSPAFLSDIRSLVVVLFALVMDREWLRRLVERRGVPTGRSTPLMRLPHVNAYQLPATAYRFSHCSTPSSFVSFAFLVLDLIVPING
ncbi:hypothetical protein V8C44DRAFT_322617 [Trichoderma aethiopicum]